ncbi:LamG domain-containing protein [Maridesulfovibrio sp.]|uniref:LamG domain-containing protein n=1 Tax=Maridesulfovibrio sp. TaxID=2795000 RepID=UPI003BAC7F42
MEADYGVQIRSGAKVVIPSNTAYSFGKGDFTIGALFQTEQPGTLLSRKSTEGGSEACAGWLLVIKPDGIIKMATDNGFGFYEVNSEKTQALDGLWHHVAAVRKKGIITIFFDGKPIKSTAKGSLASPLNISNNRRIVIGGCDQKQEPHRQFTGIIEDVILWNRALTQDEIIPTMFNLVQGTEPGLVGYWAMNNDLTDESTHHNIATAEGQITFVPVFHCTWAEADNHFSFCGIDNNYVSDYQFVARASNESVTRLQELDVPANTPFIYGGIIDKNKDELSFPTGAILKITKPDGTPLTDQNNGDDQFVYMNGASVWQFMIKNPTPGIWVISVTAQQNVPFTLTVGTTPTINVVQTIKNALDPIYPHPSSQIVLNSRNRALAAAMGWSFADVGLIIGTAIAGIGIAALLAPAAVPLSLTAAGLATLAGLGIAEMSGQIKLLTTPDSLSDAGRQISKLIGFEPTPILDEGINLTGGYVECANHAAYNFGQGDFSCEAWVKPSKQGPLFGRKSTEGKPGFIFQVNPDGVISLVTDNGAGYCLLNSPSTNVFDGRWHHIAGVRKGSDMQVFLDGQPLGGEIAKSKEPPLTVSSNIPLLIGSVQQQQQPYRFFQGTISEARLWNIARTRKEIKYYMDLCIPQDNQHLVGYWPFINKSSQDQSITKNDGTLKGSTDYVSQPGNELWEIQLGRNAAGGYEWVGEHTFLGIMKKPWSETQYPNNVEYFFDCAGGHGDEAGHKVPVTMGTLTVRGRPNDLIRMATGSNVIDPEKRIYGSGSEWGQGTAGINASGKINRNGFCHQISNRLLYSAVWPNRAVTLGHADPPIRGYEITVAWTGVFGASWGSKFHGREMSFADWCKHAGFPPPPSEDSAMYDDLIRYAPSDRKAFIKHAIDLQESYHPEISKEETDELELKFKSKLSEDISDDVISAMGLK